MAQSRIPIGEHGEVTVNQLGDGRWQARAQVRDRDGKRRSVRATGRTRGAAERLLRSVLKERTDPTIRGVTATTTVEALAATWLQHRRDHGKARSAGSLRAQTLSTYDNEIRLVIVPAIGQVQIREVNVPFLDRLLADVEHGRSYGAYPARAGGRSTRILRVVLGGMLGMAVSHGALVGNPMRDTATSSRDRRAEVRFLTVEQALHLRRCVSRAAVRIDGRRMPGVDLEEIVDFLLGTGCREGEALAVRPVDLLDLDSDCPKVRICGTLVEPRRGYIDALHRQPATKTGDERTLILPDALAVMLRNRLDRHVPAAEGPVFASRTGNWLNPPNLRSGLRRAISRALDRGTPADLELEGTTLHTLRRTVGTLLAHEVSLDAAREQLGHRDPSVTYQHYVGKRAVAPDLRSTLGQLLAQMDSA